MNHHEDPYRYSLVYETDAGEIIYLRRLTANSYERKDLVEISRSYVRSNLTFVKRLSLNENPLYRIEKITTPNGFTFRRKVKIH